MIGPSSPLVHHLCQHVLWEETRAFLSKIVWLPVISKDLRENEPNHKMSWKTGRKQRTFAETGMCIILLSSLIFHHFFTERTIVKFIVNNLGDVWYSNLSRKIKDYNCCKESRTSVVKRPVWVQTHGDEIKSKPCDDINSMNSSRKRIPCYYKPIYKTFNISPKGLKSLLGRQQWSTHLYSTAPASVLMD